MSYDLSQGRATGVRLVGGVRVVAFNSNWPMRRGKKRKRLKKPGCPREEK